MLLVEGLGSAVMELEGVGTIAVGGVSEEVITTTMQISETEVVVGEALRTEGVILSIKGLTVVVAEAVLDPQLAIHPLRVSPLMCLLLLRTVNKEAIV